MKKRTFPIEEIKNYLKQGYTIKDLAEKFETNRTTMSNFLKENELKTKKQKHLDKCNELNIEYITKEYQIGRTIKDIANELDVGEQAIKNRLKLNNVHIRTNSEAHKKYTENYEYFNNINNYDKAYLLGFICADGWVTNRNELGIQVSEKDKNIIYWFKEQLQTDKNIFNSESKDGHKSVGLIIQNEKITKVLNAYTIVPNKSLILDIKQVILNAKISEELVPAFLLGYFDGDGGIYKTLTNNTYQYSCSITGTLETCMFLKSISVILVL